MKLLVCDIEGTIFQAKYKIDGTDYASTMWQPLAKALGEKAIKEELLTHKKWENKEYDNYIQWVEATIDIHKKYKLNKDIFFGLIEDAEYCNGVVDFFADLDRSKYIPVFISGGFQELVRRAQGDLNVNYGQGACEYFFDKNSGIMNTYGVTPCDFEGKFDYIKYLFQIYDLDPIEDWVFIGDGKNDVDIAAKAPLAIGINAHEDLQKVVQYTVNNFSEIMKILIKEEKHKHISRNTSVSISDDELLDNEYEQVVKQTQSLETHLGKAFEALIDTQKRLGELTNKNEKSKGELDQKDFEILELSELESQHQKQIDAFEKDRNEAENRIDKMERTRTKYLLDTWKVHLPNFEFDKSTAKKIAKEGRADWIKIEEELKKFHNLKDPNTGNRSKIKSTGELHRAVNLSNNVPARIFYKIIGGKPARVEITDFKRKNEI